MTDKVPVKQLGKIYLLDRCPNGCNEEELIVVPGDNDSDTVPLLATAGCFFCGLFQDADTAEAAVEKWNTEQRR